MLQITLKMDGEHHATMYVAQVKREIVAALEMCGFDGVFSCSFVRRESGHGRNTRLIGRDKTGTNVHIKVPVHEKNQGTFVIAIPPQNGMSVDKILAKLAALNAREPSVAGTAPARLALPPPPPSSALTPLEEMWRTGTDAELKERRAGFETSISRETAIKAGLEAEYAAIEPDRVRLVEEIDRLRAELGRAELSLDQLQDRRGMIATAQYASADKIDEAGRGCDVIDAEFAKREKARKEAKYREMAALMESEGISALDFAEFMRMQAVTKIAADPQAAPAAEAAASASDKRT